MNDNASLPGGVFLCVMYDLVEECGLVVIHPLEDGSHERLANETTAVSDTVLLAETL